MWKLANIRKMEEEKNKISLEALGQSLFDLRDE
jgi:hypothetical protein